MSKEYKPELPSQFTINDDVFFIPMAKHIRDMCISMEVMTGTVVAVRFTIAKIFYDILDDYYGIVFENINSTKAFNDYDKANEFLNKCSSARDEMTIFSPDSDE